LIRQKINDSFERVEPERGSHRRPQVRVGVDVIENAAAIICFQVFDATDVESGRLHDPLRGRHGFAWHVRKRQKLYRPCIDDRRSRVAHTRSVFRIADR
jgi:hypothetical protein